jgi:uncharacterized protein (DUF2345 family)
MAERPNQNIYKRQLISFNPNFRIDTANPQMSGSGTDVYRLYGVTDDNDKSSISLTSSGLYSIKNDRTIEIVAGENNEGKSVDIVIVGRNGDVTITAERTGMVRIKANNIMLDADEDITLKAGRNIIQQSSSGRILLKGVSVDADGMRGNVIENMGIGFGMKVFSGSFVGADVLGSVFKAVTPFISKVF